MVKNNLTLSFIPYTEISKLKSVDRVKKVLDIILKNKIVILQGRLEATEEASLIQSTMALVGRVNGFRGVELAVVQSSKDQDVWDKFKLGIARALVGQRDVFTIVGPASVVKDIKRDPSKIELMLNK